MSQPLELALAHNDRPFGGDDVLAYYDGPLLFFLPHPGMTLLAVATDHERGPWPFFVAEITLETKEALLNNTLPLRDCYMQALRWWFMPDYGADVLNLEPAPGLPEDELPKAGVFLRL